MSVREGIADRTDAAREPLAAGVTAGDFLARWRVSAPPLRPPPAVAAAIAALLPEHGAEAPILLLGVTPEYAVIPKAVVAVDRALSMIALAWPGDSAARQAVCGDWRRLPIADRSVAGVIGDGSLIALVYPHEHLALFDRLRSLVRPGGRMVLRCFVAPDPIETLEEVAEAAFGGGIGFHEFKLRFNTAAARAAGSANVSSNELLSRFDEMFPDRNRLAQASGWSLGVIAEMDCYAGNDDNHCFPTRSELLQTLALVTTNLRFVPSGSYPLAERCPLLVAEVP